VSGDDHWNFSVSLESKPVTTISASHCIPGCFSQSHVSKQKPLQNMSTVVMLMSQIETSLVNSFLKTSSSMHAMGHCSAMGRNRLDPCGKSDESSQTYAKQQIPIAKIT
jgi:hypothetical protein